MIKNLKLLGMSVLAFAALSLSAAPYGGGGYRGGHRGQMMGQQRAQSVHTYRGGRTSCDAPIECKTCTDGLVEVRRCMPTEIATGKDFTVQLMATAKELCTNVVITEVVPEGLTYVSSNPSARMVEGKLVWDLGDMCCGECKQLCITYRAMEEGCYCICYTVHAAPCCCQRIQVGCPKLQICKTGTEKTRVCCPVHYRIIVTNCGSMIARQVCLTDHIPPELRHKSCCNTLSWNLGDMCPGETRRVDVCLESIKCGLATNSATAKSCDCPPVTATATTLIEDCCIKLKKEGPKGPVTVGQTADYKITATNEGNTTLNNVKIIDTIPGGTRITSAPGAEIHGTQAIWTVPQFGAGETKTFDLTLTSCVHGCLTNQAYVTCNQDVGDCAQASTCWQGIAGIWIGIKEYPDPVCLGATTDYSIVVQNQGHAEDTNVKLEVRFPSNFEVVAANGGPGKSTISGRKVTFEAIPRLGPGQTVAYNIKAKAVEKGDAEVKAEVTSDKISPMSKTERTTIY